jgi:3-oxoadipate enol-lactonase
MPKLSVNGQTLWCQIEGADSGPWLLFSHSLACDHRIWDDQIAPLAPLFRILRYDVRGHGQSESSPGPYSFEQLGDDVLALMDAHDIDRCHFIGTSLGGMTGLGLGINHGDRFLSLSICAANAQIPDADRAAFGDRIAFVLDNGMSAVIDGNLGRWFTPQQLAKGGPAVEKSRDMILGTQPEGYAGCAAAIRDLEYLDRLKQITLPTIVIVGAQDPGTTPEKAREIADNIPGAQFIQIDPGAHNANMENPTDFNRALTDFLTAQA